MNSMIFISLSEFELKALIKEAVFEALIFQKNQKDQEPFTEDLLNINDIQLLFNVSNVTIHKWKKKGLIPFYKMNRKVYFKKSEVINAMTHKKRKLEV
jgi:hypothetical protein